MMMPPTMTPDPFSIASAFFMHIGARNIQFDFTAGQRKVLSHPATKLVVLSAMFYISTRSLMWSMALLFTYILTIHMLLNERHPLNIFSRSWLEKEGFLPAGKSSASPIELYQENLRMLSSPTMRS